MSIHVQRRLNAPRVALLFVTSLPPLIVGSTVVPVFLSVMIERMSLSGWVHAVLGDIVVAALCGAGVLALGCGVYTPLLAYSFSGTYIAIPGLKSSSSLPACDALQSRCFAHCGHSSFSG
jgi:hypothetical protein